MKQEQKNIFCQKWNKLIIQSCFIFLSIGCVFLGNAFAQDKAPIKVSKDGKTQEKESVSKKDGVISKTYLKKTIQKEQKISKPPLKTIDYARPKMKVLRQYHRPTSLQIAIYNANGVPKSAYKLSVYLGKVKKRQIEERLGVHLDIVNIVDSPLRYAQTVLYFRENYLKSALFLASLIPGDQRILALPNQALSTGVDVLIYVGKNN